MPARFWEDTVNRKKFLDGVQQKYQIKEPRDWGKLTINDIKISGGTTLLSRYFNDSLLSCLRSVYSSKEKLHK